MPFSNIIEPHPQNNLLSVGIFKPQPLTLHTICVGITQLRESATTM